MDFKIKGKGLIIFLTAICFIGCKTSYKYPKFDYIKNNGVNPCITAFKDRIFFSILEECYKGTDAIKEINKRDVGNPYDGIYSRELFDRIDSIAKAFVIKMPPPPFCDECKPEQNYFMAQALHFYSSSDLDSIAKVELERFGMYECK